MTSKLFYCYHNENLPVVINTIIVEYYADVLVLNGEFYVACAAGELTLVQLIETMAIKLKNTSPSVQSPITGPWDETKIKIDFSYRVGMTLIYGHYELAQYFKAKYNDHIHSDNLLKLNRDVKTIDLVLSMTYYNIHHAINLDNVVLFKCMLQKMYPDGLKNHEEKHVEI